LNSGERKAFTSDKVIVIPGPSEELAVIRRIFSLYVRNQSIPEIVKHLANEGIKGNGDRPLSWRTVRAILSHELCIGQMTYNVTTRRLQGRKLKNPEELRTRFSAFEPIVPVTQFRKAQVRLARSANPHWDKEAMVASSKLLLAQKGELSQTLLDRSKDAPCAETVVKYFGSLETAYAEVGYCPTTERRVGANAKYWSTKDILTGLRKLYAARGYISNRLIDRFSDLPTHVHIQRRFGSISNAVGDAGLPVLSHAESQRCSWKRRKASGYDENYGGVRW
jgi:hypothetical protein